MGRALRNNSLGHLTSRIKLERFRGYPGPLFWWRDTVSAVGSGTLLMITIRGGGLCSTPQIRFPS